VTMAQSLIGEEDLHAYIDGLADPEQRWAVKDHLAHDPTAAARVCADREIVEQLREQLAFKAAEAIPERLRLANIMANRRLADRPTLTVLPGGRPEAAEQPVSRPVRGVSPLGATAARQGGRLLAHWRAAAAMLLATGLGGAGGWRLHEAQIVRHDDDMFGRQAAAAYIMLKQAGPQPLQFASLEQLSGDLSRVLGSKLQLRDSAESGFILVGAWVMPSIHGQAVQLAFRDMTDSKLLTMYLENRSGAADTPFRPVPDAAMPTVSWNDDGLACAISGLADPKHLEQVGRRLYEAVLDT
jgi:anti-sigma factor RsiW